MKFRKIQPVVVENSRGQERDGRTKRRLRICSRKMFGEHIYFCCVVVLRPR